MSDGITLHCPKCGTLSYLKKENGCLKLQLKQSNGITLFDSQIPVYTCKKCGQVWGIQRVVKKKLKCSIN